MRLCVVGAFVKPCGLIGACVDARGAGDEAGELESPRGLFEAAPMAAREDSVFGRCGFRVQSAPIDGAAAALRAGGRPDCKSLLRRTAKTCEKAGANAPTHFRESNKSVRPSRPLTYRCVGHV